MSRHYKDEWDMLLLGEAAAKSTLVVTIVGRPKGEASFPLTLKEYEAVVETCYPRQSNSILVKELERNSDGSRSEDGDEIPSPRPTSLSLTIMRDDLGMREQVPTLARVLELATDYVNTALRDTSADRKALGRNIDNAATKRSGQDLPGRAGH